MLQLEQAGKPRLLRLATNQKELNMYNHSDLVRDTATVLTAVRYETEDQPRRSIIPRLHVFLRSLAGRPDHIIYILDPSLHDPRRFMAYCARLTAQREALAVAAIFATETTIQEQQTLGASAPVQQPGLLIGGQSYNDDVFTRLCPIQRDARDMVRIEPERTLHDPHAPRFCLLDLFWKAYTAYTLNHMAPDHIRGILEEQR